MSDITALIETMEHRWMRAWVNRDSRTLKSLTARDFILLTGSKPPSILDRRSWLEAGTKRYHCSSYRFGDIYVRRFGAAALFASQVELRTTMDGRDWGQQVWLTDLWSRRRMGRGWKLVQRVLSHVEEDPELPKAMKALQLWK